MKPVHVVCSTGAVMHRPPLLGGHQTCAALVTMTLIIAPSVSAIAQPPAVIHSGANGTVVNTNNGVYAGHDGNVYKRDAGGGWSQYSNGGWNTVDRSTAQSQGLNQSAESRQRGETATRRFQGGGARRRR